MPIKKPKERPDLYDSYDVPAREFEPSAAYRKATMPSWMREAIMSRAGRTREHRGAPQSAGKVRVLKLRPAVQLVSQWASRKSITVMSLPASEGNDKEALRRAEIQALRDFADRLEGKEIQPGPLIVDIPGGS